MTEVVTQEFVCEDCGFTTPLDNTVCPNCGGKIVGLDSPSKKITHDDDDLSDEFTDSPEGSALSLEQLQEEESAADDAPVDYDGIDDDE